MALVGTFFFNMFDVRNGTWIYYCVVYNISKTKIQMTLCTFHRYLWLWRIMFAIAIAIAIDGFCFYIYWFNLLSRPLIFITAHNTQRVKVPKEIQETSIYKVIAINDYYGKRMIWSKISSIHAYDEKKKNKNEKTINTRHSITVNGQYISKPIRMLKILISMHWSVI